MGNIFKLKTTQFGIITLVWRRSLVNLMMLIISDDDGGDDNVASQYVVIVITTSTIQQCAIRVYWPITNNEHCLCLCYRLCIALVKCLKDHSIRIIITTSTIQSCARVCWPITNNGTILASLLPLPTL